MTSVNLVLAELTSTARGAQALAAIVAGAGAGKGKGKKKGDKAVAEEEDLTSPRGQLDAALPPELPTAWVQCESCRKWRRVAWHVDADALPDDWTCSQNTWQPELASCATPQDSWDPERELTVETNGAEEAQPGVLVEGAWRDVFCLGNKVYYEGQAVEFKDGGGEGKPRQVRFHFKGWGPKFDEWMPEDSERIKPHNLFTDPTTDCPRAQERWQGKFVPFLLSNKATGAAGASGSPKDKSKGKGKGRGGGAKKKRKSGEAAPGAEAEAGAAAEGEERGESDAMAVDVPEVKQEQQRG